jgi:hypothetical protein
LKTLAGKKLIGNRVRMSLADNKTSELVAKFYAYQQNPKPKLIGWGFWFL